VQIFLTGEATYLMRKATADAVLPVVWPPLSEMREKVVAKRIPLFEVDGGYRPLTGNPHAQVQTQAKP